ncbi:MAG TPA: spermidine/putrescine ABC transporter substrate-binding protein [Candidatus Aphodoplasma excrementigallinarum]|uniref:Spermidine/putrescine ABC transporter substrate-binding protein n=1 Tax=Candidatus Aphodoplasma excrementigallinarum TaxID=2840673 RepID=A0A9D1SZQ0_9FIRM|nr:spermidine/putrescine ABC transporter substrate-binding protein [Candidatus Aphodoplasma excrementigallinarum]
MKKTLKKIGVLMCAALVAVASLAGCSSDGGEEKVTLRVYNWGEYIAPGLLEQFEEETGIHVEYDTFNDNESMYAKVKNSGSDSYDIVVPSDYMIKKMIEEDMLAPINYDNVPNIKNLDPSFTNLSYDPEGTYSVPYLWGTVGILYDIDQTGRELTSMKDMFDPAFARKVCMLDSIRDTIGMTLKMQGYSMNDLDPAHIAEVRDILLEQKPNVLAYGTDELPAKVIGGTAAMAMVYSGEGIRAVEEQPENMRFVIPEEGSNLAVDSFVILKTSQNKEAAEQFLNFMLDADVALENAIETGYSTTNAAAREMLPDEIKNDPGRYPSQDVLDKCEIFETLPADNTDYIDAWNQIKAK